MKRSALVIALVSIAVAMTVPASAASFSDAFDRTDNASLGAPWSFVSSTWGVRSNGARFLTGAYTSTTGLAVVDAGTTQISVAADITLSPTPLRSNAGLALAAKDYKNNLFCKIEITDKNPNGLMAIGRRLNNVITSQLASAKNLGLVSGGTYPRRLCPSGERHHDDRRFASDHLRTHISGYRRLRVIHEGGLPRPHRARRRRREVHLRQLRPLGGIDPSVSLSIARADARADA